MITQRGSIDYVPLSRDKRYYCLLPQMRSAVQPDTKVERFWFKDKGYVPWRRIAVLSTLTAVLSLLLVFGWFDWLWWIFQN